MEGDAVPTNLKADRSSSAQLRLQDRLSYSHFNSGGVGQSPCIHQLFEQQVQRTPNATAIVLGDHCLTYQELNQRANMLARQLRNLGVGPRSLVGLLVDRSLEMVIGIIGVLKAGGAYVPLDPTYPQERLADVIADAQLSVLVAQRFLQDSLPKHDAKFVFVNVADPLLLGREEPAPNLRSSDPAYVIFTSGSTGRPKGVVVSHHNVVRLFRSTQPWFGFDSNDVWTLFHSFAFDFSVWELWGALINGGRLVLVPHDICHSPRAFYDLLQAEQVTVLNQTPSAFRHLIQYEESAGSAADLALRLVIFGGESLTLAMLKPWFDRHGDQRPRLVNMYGITETTVHVTYRPITRADLDMAQGSVIGRPIPDLQVHLLDSQQRPVPQGDAGEIYVGGEGVALGYLGQPELTSERFLPDPFRDDPTARLYRSGDLARLMSDGDLIYVGRIDHQVKIRGFRIELLEIESVLARHESVRETVVLARQDTPDEKRLVAYVAPTQTPAPTVHELRSFLTDKLPDYMVPSAFVFMDRLPVTANGKLDRDQLPVPSLERPGVEASYVPPQDSCQKRLQSIWQELLHVQPIGIRDNFFELGGDSLLAVRLGIEMKKAFGCDLSGATLLEDPTIEHIAHTVRGHKDRTHWSSLIAIQPQGTKPPFFCVHPLGGQAYGYRLIAKYLGTDQPFYGLQARELHDSSQPFTRLEDMAAHYLNEALQVQPQGPYFLGGYSLGAFVAFEMAQQLYRQGNQVAFLAVLDDGPSLIYGNPTYDASEMAHFLANVPRWLLHQLVRKKPGTLLSDIMRKLRHGMRKVAPNQSTEHADVERVMDVSRYSESERRTLALHYQALKDYKLKKYPGRITLFRARTQPLLGSHQPALGWNRVAASGVDVHVVPGDHNSFVMEPHVRVLSARLAEAMTRDLVGARSF
jgi:amino acid adenylation domain-containing protein